MRLRTSAGALILLFVFGCAPVVRLPAAEARVAPVAAPATNPGKVILVMAGAFSALLVLILILVGTDISGD